MAVENREQIDLAEFGAVRLGIGAAIFGHDHAAETRGATRRQRRFSGAFGAAKADVTGHAGAVPAAAAQRHWISPSIERPSRPPSTALVAQRTRHPQRRTTDRSPKTNKNGKTSC